MGVTSAMLVICSPQLLSARTADSRPGPGPPTRTSTFFTPCSWAATPARSPTTCAANGVDLREPRKPQPPEVAQDSVLPWRSVIVMMVLLKDACTCAIASSTFLRTFLRAGLLACAPLCPAFCFCSAIIFNFQRRLRDADLPGAARRIQRGRCGPVPCSQDQSGPLDLARRRVHFYGLLAPAPAGS